MVALLAVAIFSFISGNKVNIKNCKSSFLSSKIEISLPNNTHHLFSKVSLMLHPWPEMDAKVGHFQCKSLRLLAVALLFWWATTA
jgi:hypothetical protein